MAYPNLFVINYLKISAPWDKKIFKRLLIQFSSAVLIAIIISSCFTLFANFLKPYKHDLSNVLLNNALIFSVVNILLMSILESLIFSKESKQAQQIADNLKEELSQMKFELLKSQINPHFMFNSLNVLSGLVSSNAKKAQQFIDEFSHIYRYVLETIEHSVSTLNKELDFMRSYLFLQQLRYGDNLSYSVNIPASMMNYFLPPLSLQIVLENAIKHNVANESKPLHIEIYYQDFYLIVKNNIQPKVSIGKSTGIGLKNLQKRYVLISENPPTFTVEDNFFIAKLPLIQNEDDLLDS
jgi:LytS/YehU family sensor histidine kinase